MRIRDRNQFWRDQPGGALTTISSCAFAGEYATITGAVNGQTLRFASGIGFDYITIRSGIVSGPVVAAGFTTLVFANTFSGNLFVHWHADATCGAQSTCRISKVQLVSPPIFLNGYE